jgi:hypothetical protein
MAIRSYDRPPRGTDMALLKPSERFRTEIKPAFADYLADVLSERLATNLARAIDHHLDWTYEYHLNGDQSRLLGAKDVKAFRRAVFGQCPELEIMWDISDAAHHRFLTRPARPGVTRTVPASSDALTVQADELWVKHFNRPFLPAATTAVEFWRRWPD